jgi:hemolysin activation/secretion protein
MNNNRFMLAGSVAGTLALAVAGVHAQTVPNSGDVLRQLPPPVLPAPPPALPPVGNTPTEPPMQALPNNGPSVNVASFRIVGNREIGSAELMAQLPAPGARAYTLAELEAVALRLTRYYRAKGYFVARAYVPAQEMNDTGVTLRVVEGNYGRFVLDNRSRVRDDIVQGLLDDVKKYDIVSLDTLERAMLIINDTPGVKVVRADVMPGTQVGTSDFAIGTAATPAVTGYALLDNYGSVYTGKRRLSGNIDWNSPSGRGDRLSASGLLTDGGGLYNGRLEYSALVAANGTRASLALARTRYELGDSYEALGATGTADSVELGFTTPIKRTRASSIEAGLTVAVRRLRDEISATATLSSKRSYSATASLSARREGALFGYDGLTVASAALTGGYLDFRDAAAESLDAAGQHTQGSYGRFNLSASRVWLLPRQYSLAASMQGQLALGHRNLDGSERLSVSGMSGVLAYPIGELSGDHAAVLRLELSRAFATTGQWQWSGSAFADYGWARAVHAQGELGDGRTLGDAGLGLNLSIPGGGLAKLQVARRTTGGDPVSESIAHTVLRLQAGWIF